MLNKFGVIIFCLFQTVQFVSAGVEIVKITGEVKIRRGVEETWQPASAGTFLDEIDSILTGEGGAVILKIYDGSTFKLGANAILDITDLRKITEREMFLYLMSKKIDRISPREDKSRLKIGNVHVVHGELKSDTDASGSVAGEWRMEQNGARALYEHALITNAVVKLNKIIKKYPDTDDCGELHFHLGLFFESLDKRGQALDAYQIAQQKSHNDCDPKWRRKAELAMRRIK